jgi:hypothetical protein
VPDPVRHVHRQRAGEPDAPRRKETKNKTVLAMRPEGNEGRNALKVAFLKRSKLALIQRSVPVSMFLSAMLMMHGYIGFGPAMDYALDGFKKEFAQLYGSA